MDCSDLPSCTARDWLCFQDAQLSSRRRWTSPVPLRPRFARFTLTSIIGRTRDRGGVSGAAHGAVHSSSVDRSPSGRPWARALSTRRMILPERVLGSDVHERHLLGPGDGSDVLGDVLAQFLGQRLGWCIPGSEDAVGVDGLALDLVGQADGRGLGHGRVAHQRALDLRGPQAVARHLDHVVHAADDPEVAVRVPLGRVAGRVPARGQCSSTASRSGPGPCRSSAAWPARGASGPGSPPRRSGTGLPCSSTISASWPKKGRVPLPGFSGTTGVGVIMNIPVSVCHQVSMMGQRSLPMTRWYHFQASGLIGSPTEPRRRSDGEVVPVGPGLAEAHQAADGRRARCTGC